MSVTVLVDMQIKPEAVEEMKSLLKKILPDTRAYDGCQSVDIYGNVDDSGNLVFYERWDSRKHHESYNAWRSKSGILDQTAAWLAGRPSIRYFERIDV